MSFFKINCLHPDTLVRVTERHMIGGITEGKTITLGTINTKIGFDSPEILPIIAKFHILPESHFPFDGIVGRDLLHLWDAVIYMREKRVFFKSLQIAVPFIEIDQMREDPSSNAKTNLPGAKKDSKITTPNQSQENMNHPPSILQKSKEKILYTTTPTDLVGYSQQVSKFHLHPNGETLVEFTFFTNSPLVCHQKALDEDNTIFIPDCVIAPVNYKAQVPIINTNGHAIDLLNISPPSTEPLSNYESFTMDSQLVNHSLGERNRGDIIFEQIQLNPSLDSQYKARLREMCEKYNATFHLEGDALSHVIGEEYKIETYPDADIVNEKSYRIPFHQRPEAKRQLQTMLDSEIIRPSCSPYNSPLLLVPKKPDAHGNKQWRIVVDFRRLNDITVKDKYPLASIEDIFDQLGNSKYYSTLDLASGFFQMKLSEDSKHKTAFNALGQHFEFERLAFGLSCAPAAFSRLIRNALGDLLEGTCFAYIDDIVVYSTSISEHLSKLETVLQRLSEHKLQLNPGKCKIIETKLVYLGFVISSEGLRPDPKKTEAVSNFPVPTCVKEVKSFLGLASYYRRFIADFAEIAYPLTNLIHLCNEAKKSQDLINPKRNYFPWTPECQSSFDSLKEKLTSFPVLAYPDFDKEFTLTTDASNYAIGAILSQEGKVISYGSRVLKKAEKNYSTIEKEALAVYFFITYYRVYLLGKEFTVVSDHQPLQWIYNKKNPSSRIIRWRLQLSEFTFKVVYKKGELNTNADALSRLPIKDSEKLDLECLFCGENPDINTVPITSSRELDSHVVTRSQTRALGKITIPEEDSPSPYDDYEKFVSLREIDVPDVVSEQQEEFLSMKEKGHQFLVVCSDNTIEDFPNFDKTLVADALDKLQKYSLNMVEVRGVHFIFGKLGQISKMTYPSLFRLFFELKEFCIAQNIRELIFSKSNITFPQFEYLLVKRMINYVFKTVNIQIRIYFNQVKRLHDPEEIQDVIKEFHENPIYGHRGVTGTHLRIKDKYIFKNMRRIVARYINRCETCQKNKISRSTRMPLKLTTTPPYPFFRITMDVLGPLSETHKQNKYILVIQDELSKYLVAESMTDQTANTVAETFVNRFVCVFGAPIQICSDQGGCFNSATFKHVCKLLNIHKKFATPFHPQTSGTVERSNRTIGEYLRIYTKNGKRDWDTILPMAVAAYNSAVHQSHNMTPHEIIFGEKFDITSFNQPLVEPTYCYDDFVTELRRKLSYSQKIAAERLNIVKEKSKTYYDNSTNPVTFKVGDQVLLLNKSLPKSGESSKLLERRKGPYTVTKIVTPLTTTIKINNKEKTYHNNLLKLYKE